MSEPLTADDRELLWGWTQTLDIPSAVSLIAPRRLTDCYALISVIDSSSRVTALPGLIAERERRDSDYAPLGDGLVVPWRVLAELIRAESFFTGFDELWLFGEQPTEAKPESVPLTSDLPLRGAPAGALIDWTRRTRAVAGLGDGDGLNFVTFCPSLAALWTAPYEPEGRS